MALGHGIRCHTGLQPPYGCFWGLLRQGADGVRTAPTMLWDAAGL